jgi:predicted Zn-dependent peptidase
VRAILAIGPVLLAAGSAGAAALRYDIQQHRLDNGLRVALVPERSAPTVAVALSYDVGSRNEVRGRTGFAHLFEHLMFQGSEHVAKGEHLRYVQDNGGVVNAGTSEDRTIYYQEVPSGRLELVLWLEADRMRSLAITQTTLDNQRHAVQEERRLRVDNQPYVPAFLRLGELLFGNFANAHSPIGSMEDLNAASLADVQEFFDRNYAPNNAAIAIAGDFDPTAALALVEQYFGPIPSAPAQPAPEVAEPPRTHERREIIADANAQVPAWIAAYQAPPRHENAARALELASIILAGGESSWLTRKLVKEEGLAIEVQALNDLRRGPGAIGVLVLAAPGKSMERLEQLIHEQVGRLADPGPSEAELAKAKNRWLADYTEQLQRHIGLARQAAMHLRENGDARELLAEPDRYQAVQLAELVQAARRHLRAENRAIVRIDPQPPAQDGS